MSSQAFFASRWVIVAAWLLGVLPLVLSAACFSLSNIPIVGMFTKTLLGFAAVLIGLHFLSVAWRIAAYPLLMIDDTKISINRPFARRRAMIMARRGIDRVLVVENRLVFHMRDGGTCTLAMKLVPTRDREDLLRLFPLIHAA
ncbi:MAG: hypothetical protein QNK37_28550 [Acidobacteriota bacterium]|nr:hypothetical protein [Acidobacteriota bacterium]